MESILETWTQIGKDGISLVHDEDRLALSIERLNRLQEKVNQQTKDDNLTAGRMLVGHEPNAH